jgi:hypothetical protein
VAAEWLAISLGRTENLGQAHLLLVSGSFSLVSKNDLQTIPNQPVAKASEP